MGTVDLRPAAPGDAPRLQDIERAAAQRFRDIGYDRVADDPPDSVEVLTGYADAHRAWVAETEAGEVIGYVLVAVVDGGGHIEQVTVHPDHQGTGVGKQLIGQAAEWARTAGRTILTLTTFSEVPWNRPLYEHLGFRVLRPGEVGAELRAIQAREAAHGIGPEGRVAMILDLGGQGAR